MKAKITIFTALIGLLFSVSSCIDTDIEEPDPVDPAEIRAQNRDDIQQYLEINDITNADSTASGLYYVIEEEGNGTHPQIGDTITVQYSGYSIYDGSVFDNGNGQPQTFELDQVIEGWREGVPNSRKVEAAYC